MKCWKNARNVYHMFKYNAHLRYIYILPVHQRRYSWLQCIDMIISLGLWLARFQTSETNSVSSIRKSPRIFFNFIVHAHTHIHTHTYSAFSDVISRAFPHRFVSFAVNIKVAVTTLQLCVNVLVNNITFWAFSVCRIKFECAWFCWVVLPVVVMYIASHDCWCSVVDLCPSHCQSWLLNWMTRSSTALQYDLYMTCDYWCLMSAYWYRKYSFFKSALECTTHSIE